MQLCPRIVHFYVKINLINIPKGLACETAQSTELLPTMFPLRDQGAFYISQSLEGPQQCGVRLVELTLN